MNIVAAPKV